MINKFEDYKKKKDMAVERYRESMRIKRKNRLDEYYKFQKEKWLPLSKRVWAYKTTIKENILMAIKAISDNYANRG